MTYIRRLFQQRFLQTRAILQNFENSVWFLPYDDNCLLKLNRLYRVRLESMKSRKVSSQTSSLAVQRRIACTTAWSWLVIGILVSGMGYPATAATIRPEMTVAADSQSAKQIRTLSAAALAKVAYLRKQADQNKSNSTKNYLTQLNTLFDLIDAARPTGEIDSLLTFYQEHLSFEDNAQALADLLPLYHALKALPHSKSLTTAQKYLNQARSALQDNKRAETLKSLQNMQRALAIDGLDFPLQAAREKLQKITRFYDLHNAMPRDGTLLEMETDLLQIINTLS